LTCIADIEMTKMKIAILGAGSLGCAIGGVLAEAGSDVWLINRNAKLVDALNNTGLVLCDGGVDRVVQVKATTSAQAAGVVDLVVVLVKSFDTAAAITASMSLLGPKTHVLSLQNGVGHEEILAELVGRERVIGGKTYAGGSQLGVAHISIGTRGKETIIGELDGGVSERTTQIANLFTAAGLQTTVSSNIMQTIWEKLLVNVSTGALCAITGLPYGKLYAVPEVEATALAAVAEAMAVAKASGVQLTTTDAKQPWLKAAAGLPPEFKTSMLQSLEKGSVTEIDYINGAVVRQGQKYGIPTPVNQTLVACIKGIEATLSA
jgi:2-dehydropantoate 2-reductase